MPTYEYRCSEGHGFERFQSMSDESISKCPECGAVSERLLSGGAGFIFKGEGFYITDYRSEDYKKAASSDSEAAKSSESKPSPSETDSSSSSTSGSGKMGSKTDSTSD